MDTAQTSSSSDTDTSSSGTDSDPCISNLASQKVKHKKFKNNKQTNKQTDKANIAHTVVRPISTPVVQKQIESMRAPLYKLLKAREGHSDHLRNLNLRELKTFKSIFKSVERLKGIRQINGLLKVPESTIASFKKCKKEIDEFYSTNKKNEMQKALLAISERDDFQSIRNILIANHKLYRMYKSIESRESAKNGKRFILQTHS